MTQQKRFLWTWKSSFIIILCMRCKEITNIYVNSQK